MLKEFGIKNTENSGNQLYLAEADHEFATKYFGENKLDEEKVIAIAPGGAVNPGMKQFSKRWPSKRYAEAITKISEKISARFLFIGGPSDEEVISEITNLLPEKLKKKIVNSAGKTSIHESAALIEKCALFIGNDSGSLHIASTTNTPIIGIFGPTNPVVDGPYKLKGKNLFHETKDSPCYTIDCSGHKPCIEEVSVDEVVQSAINFVE